MRYVETTDCLYTPEYQRVLSKSNKSCDILHQIEVLKYFCSTIQISCRLNLYLLPLFDTYFP